MKLYTEKEVRTVIMVLCELNSLKFDLLMDSLTPIELPSDEEIEKQLDEQDEYSYAKLQAAIWMREQIINQNK